ncbi:hypothetical protein ElyMa_003154500 [Elysia marginata]|uniref:Uncharacterized protein n=1 Tax=Elysia marginata TaxID=1093978 RepID=A0AAV4IYK7_9GAST|nr:hypothetical protein ElyMa_003154500 [Elysia marginata]
MAIQDSKLPEGWAPPRGFQLLSSEDPSRGASLFIRNSIRATKLILNTNLVAVAARISCPKAVTVCSTPREYMLAMEIARETRSAYKVTEVQFSDTKKLSSGYLKSVRPGKKRR